MGGNQRVRPRYGYFTNPGKTVLIVKPKQLELANQLFGKEGIKISDGGHRDLGAAIASDAFITKYLTEKVAMWTQQMETLSKFAITQPHASHAAYVHGMKHRWSYCQSTMKKVKDLMRPLETVIREMFIPNLLDEKTPISENYTLCLDASMVLAWIIRLKTQLRSTTNLFSSPNSS